jgi:hypothetical protein
MQRVKLLWVTYEILAALLFGKEWRRTTHSEIPADAQLVSVHDDPTSARVGLRFTHPGFPEVRDGYVFDCANAPCFEAITTTDPAEILQAIIQR